MGVEKRVTSLDAQGVGVDISCSKILSSQIIDFVRALSGKIDEILKISTRLHQQQATDRCSVVQRRKLVFSRN